MDKKIVIEDIQIEDLLERSEIDLNDNKVKEDILGKVVIVTGAGGSIGSELCKQIASFNPKLLLMLDIYENTLYELDIELRRKYPMLELKSIIASVRDSKRINEIFEEFKPNLVFHAAAHKHVPLMEISPIEAIKNNVFGTYNVAKAADKFGTQKFVLVSTDKAVNPTSIMGATKRICEMIIQMMNSSSITNYVAVRFGNVLGSHGSVIPIFKKQIKEGGPVTVTHKDVTRYFMTIPEAVGLILKANTFALGGEIFVLDMGKQIRIYDLAVNMIKLCGYEPDKDIKIEFTGLRPGEKLYEELLVNEEGLSKTLHEKIMVTKIMDFDPKLVKEELEKLKELITSEEKVSKEDIKRIIKEIVPIYIECGTN
ncbi:MAG: polysaccharide biosynthesis protein [Bacilli bacterium]|nr:polysaccharide biosynthesis protein [Bacilli bacterium]